ADCMVSGAPREAKPGGRHAPPSFRHCAIMNGMGISLVRYCVTGVPFMQSSPNRAACGRIDGDRAGVAAAKLGGKTCSAATALRGGKLMIDVETLGGRG